MQYQGFRLFQLADECEERQENEPLIVVLDSMGGRQDEAVQDILQYLTVEWDKNTYIDKSKTVFPFDSSEMVLTTPKCPGQPDFSSCGLYLIQYITKVFEDIDKFSMLQSYKTIENWINEDEMKMKRSDIASLLKNISREQGRFDHLIFPEVNFFPRSESSLTVENEDWEYFNAYVKSAAETQTDFSLCRQYSLQTFVPLDRHRQLVALLSQFQHKMKTQCITIGLFKDYLKDDYPYTESEIMCCLKQMEKDGMIMMDKNEIYLLNVNNPRKKKNNN
jgi:hypothetical protein